MPKILEQEDRVEFGRTVTVYRYVDADNFTDKQLACWYSRLDLAEASWERRAAARRDALGHEPGCACDYCQAEFDAQPKFGEDRS